MSKAVSKFVLDYPNGYFPISEVCGLCVNLLKWDSPPRCKAFKNNIIPFEIWGGKNKHKKPFPGDNGIEFEPRKVNYA